MASNKLNGWHLYHHGSARFLLMLLGVISAGGVSGQVVPYAVPAPATPATQGEIAIHRAADPVPGQPVADRPRPDYDPIGQHVGDFLVFPSLGTSLSFDDNIFGQSRGTRSDEVVKLAPQIATVSDWGRHELDALIGGRLDRFINFSGEDIEAGQARIHGRLDASHDDQIDLLSFLQHDASPRAVAEGRSFGPRQLFDAYGVTASYQHLFDRVALKTSASVQGLSYESPLDGDLQRQNYIAAERVSYEVSPRVAAYLQSSYNVERYARGGFARDGDVWTNLIGSRFDFDSVLIGEFGIGALRKAYRDPQIGDHAGLALDSRVIWNVTQLTSLILSARRNDTPTRIIQAGAGTAAGRIDTLAEIEIQHDLHHDILLKADFSYQDTAYSQLDGDQTTKLASLGGRYFLSRFLSIDTTISYASRSGLPSLAAITPGLNLGAYDEATLTVAAIAQF